jgi:hypothetical protein
MKKMLTVLLVAFISSLTSSAQSNDVIKEKVRKAHQSFIDGILAEDYQVVDQLLSEDVTLGFPDGGFSPKRGYVDALKTKHYFTIAPPIYLRTLEYMEIREL